MRSERSIVGDRLTTLGAPSRAGGVPHGLFINTHICLPLLRPPERHCSAGQSLAQDGVVLRVRHTSIDDGVVGVMMAP
jgi:hypothetical protein